jgi:hypothetical protein
MKLETTKNEVLTETENPVSVLNKFGDEIAEGYRIENWSTGLLLSDNSVIRFDQVAQVGKGFIKLTVAN